MPEAGDILIDAKTMLSAVGKPGIAILDARDVDEWIGDSSSPYGKDFCPRKGRISFAADRAGAADRNRCDDESGVRAAITWPADETQFLAP